MMKCYGKVVTVPADAGRPRVLRDLHKVLLKARSFQYAEIWVDHGNYPSLCALVNGDRAWLMYLRYDGDAGFSSRNPWYKGSKSAVIEYLLCNGQLDEYPASWAYPTGKVFNALESFAATRKTPSSIKWFNDSGDGNASPNDSFEIPA